MTTPKAPATVQDIFEQLWREIDVRRLMTSEYDAIVHAINAAAALPKAEVSK